ncbi:Cullin-domain-containing protein [Ascobolus immersus RN42]|uniref:Cullin-domain-containing protein n=1 Tax=Ascobolus immersus RN42 TaxID=1160509 RepID=A0A3N4IKR6_ASCIM|nr:Cullin-domain-containing protein [Ascobolus immersus RN42]
MCASRPRTKIRAPRRGLTGDHVDFDETWGVLAQSLREIHSQNASRLSFEELYRNAYKLVLKKFGDRLYQNVLDLISDHLLRVGHDDVRPLKPNSAVSGNGLFSGSAELERREAGTRFLIGLKRAWENHLVCLRMINDVLMYMDRSYCSDKDIPSIYVAAMGLFRDKLLYNQDFKVGETLNKIILDQIRMERDGDVIDRNSIRSCICMLDALYESDKELPTEKLYLTRFEKEFLASSTEFYKAEAEKLMRECDTASYFRLTSKRLKEETDRVQAFLCAATEQKIVRVVEKEMIESNLKEILKTETGLVQMIDNDKYEDIELVYRLSLRVDKDLTVVKSICKARIIEMGKELIKNLGAAGETNAATGTASSSKTPTESQNITNQTLLSIDWVEKVLVLKDKFDRILEQAMSKDGGMHIAFTQAFSEFINDFNRSAEYVSLFLDENMKKGIKGKSEAEVEAILDKAIVLFRYISDKDRFERYYNKHLARRLLTQRSISHDSEKQMIAKMKLEVGIAFTTKLEGMFRDMNVSDDLNAEYKAARAEARNASSSSAPKKVELTVNILTPTHWPSVSGGLPGEETQTCTFPEEIKSIVQDFETFYMSKHNGRLLKWQPQLGTADIRATFAHRKHELNVPTHSMIILLAFNDLPDEDPTLSYEQLKTITSIPENDLKRNLQSLAVAPKSRILIKKPMSREINSTDVFTFNKDFQSKLTRVKIGLVQSNRVETEKEKKETDEKVEEQRGHQIEAAIVRIMKQRKTMNHADLTHEVIGQLSNRFNPEPTLIKKRLESLMEREYIERVEGQRSVYRYLVSFPALIRPSAAMLIV